MIKQLYKLLFINELLILIEWSYVPETQKKEKEREDKDQLQEDDHLQGLSILMLLYHLLPHLFEN